jgi:cytochrome c peroxidase
MLAMKQKKLLSRKSTFLYLACAFGLILFVRCSKDDAPDNDELYLSLPGTPYDYVSLPTSGLPHPANDANNPDNLITNDGATLGRVLFYDKLLSGNNQVSCASCHKQEFSFADNVAKSQGVNGQTIRNSMHLVNIRHFAGGFFWDSRVQGLETQTLIPIQDHIEMDLTLPEMITKLENATYYQALFEKAFGDSEITSDRVSKALSQFIRSLNSYNSKYDRGVPRTAQEQLGFEKFFDFQGSSDPMTTSCVECHSGLQLIAFTDYDIPALNFTLNANGRGFEDEPIVMKVANMKNVELTAPYGHDGRYATLDILFQHHGNDVSAQDRANLIAFLKTLTDKDFIKDVRYSNPFKQK